MKIEKINDTQLLWSLDRNDMIENKVDVNDFLTGTQKARSLFQEAMKRAKQELSFEFEGYILYCQLQEFDDDKMIFSITKKKEIEQHPYLVCEFESLDEVIEISMMLHQDMELENSLYKLDDLYLLFLEPKQDQEQQLIWCTIKISEFADVSALTAQQKAYLQEHSECILEKYALQKLQKLS